MLYGNRVPTVRQSLGILLSDLSQSTLTNLKSFIALGQEELFRIPDYRERETGILAPLNLTA